MLGIHQPNLLRHGPRSARPALCKAGIGRPILLGLVQGPIVWTSKKQTTVAMSTMEAEYMVLSDTSREIVIYLTFSRTLNIELPLLILYTNNEAAESIVQHEPNYQRSKHVNIRYHFVRDHCE
jgi:hypothetical protein